MKMRDNNTLTQLQYIALIRFDLFSIIYIFFIKERKIQKRLCIFELLYDNPS